MVHTEGEQSGQCSGTRSSLVDFRRSAASCKLLNPLCLGRWGQEELTVCAGDTQRVPLLGQGVVMLYSGGAPC